MKEIEERNKLNIGRIATNNNLGSQNQGSGNI